MQIKDLNSISISIFVSNPESNFGGGGWKNSNSTVTDMRSYLADICNFPQNFSLFMECFKRNTFNATESFDEVEVNGEDFDLENLSPQLYDMWFSKFYVLNHSFVHENDSFNIWFNNNEEFEYFIRKQFI